MKTCIIERVHSSIKKGLMRNMIHQRTKNIMAVRVGGNKWMSCLISARLVEIMHYLVAADDPRGAAFKHAARI
jgi:hypothetical protein